MPEGINIDTSITDAVKALAKENGWSQDQAQKVSDVAAQVLQHQATTYAETVNGWLETAKADPDLGKDWTETEALVAKTRDAYVTEPLKELFNASGLGNHPEMIRLFARIGRELTEDKVHGAQPGDASPPTAAKRAYPDMA